MIIIQITTDGLYSREIIDGISLKKRRVFQMTIGLNGNEIQIDLNTCLSRDSWMRGIEAN